MNSLSTSISFCLLSAALCMTGCSQQSSTHSSRAHQENSASDNKATGNHEWFVFLTHGLPEQVLTDVKVQLQSVIADVAREQDVVHVISAPDHRPIASLAIPRGDSRTRLRHPESKRQLQRIGRFLQATRDEQAHQLQIPAIPATVLSLRRTGYPAQIVLVGDPIYHDPRQTGWSMVDGFVPTDASVTSPICPFGSGVATFPEQTEITWLTPTSTWGADHLHQSAVTRFYQIFFRQNGGHLARITADTTSAFSLAGTRLNDEIEADVSGPAKMRLVSVESTRPDVEPVVNTIGYETNQQRVAGSSDRQTVPAEQHEPQGTRDVPDDVEVLLEEAEHTPNRMTFALNWESEDARCDLDMYLADSRAPEELSFRTDETPFGHLLRDVQHSGSIDGGEDFAKWEVAEVNHDQLREMQLWINVYKTTRAARARLIVIWKSQRREISFEFATTTGNKGAEPRSNEAMWRRIDLVSMFDAQ